MDTLTIHIDFKSSESFQDLINRLNRLEQLLLCLSGQSVNTCKQVMTFNETAQYLGVSKSYLYKLTSTQRIPHYKPTGKRICFDLNELNEWRKQNRVRTIAEIEQEASSFLLKNRRK